MFRLEPSTEGWTVYLGPNIVGRVHGASDSKPEERRIDLYATLPLPQVEEVLQLVKGGTAPQASAVEGQG